MCMKAVKVISKHIPLGEHHHVWCMALTCHPAGALLYLLKVSFWETGSGNLSSVVCGGGADGGGRSDHPASSYPLRMCVCMCVYICYVCVCTVERGS